MVYLTYILYNNKTYYIYYIYHNYKLQNTTCFCGDSYGSYGTSTPCDILCNGDPSRECGGDTMNSIYRLGNDMCIHVFTGVHIRTLNSIYIPYQDIFIVLISNMCIKHI